MLIIGTIGLSNFMKISLVIIASSYANAKAKLFVLSLRWILKLLEDLSLSFKIIFLTSLKYC